MGISALVQRGVSAVRGAVGFLGGADERRLEKKRSTLGYVSTELDRLDELGATEKLRKAERHGVLDHIRRHPKDEALLLECVHTFNRIAAGIHNGTLDEEVIFQTWPPLWFERQWEALEDLVRREQEHQEVKESYWFFEWLATERCPSVRDMYPETDGE